MSLGLDGTVNGSTAFVLSVVTVDYCLRLVAHGQHLSILGKT